MIAVEVLKQQGNCPIFGFLGLLLRHPGTDLEVGGVDSQNSIDCGDLSHSNVMSKESYFNLRAPS